MSGTVTGGWGYVFGAYAVSAIVFGYYAVRTFITLATHKER